ncbi:MAG: TonB-dependent receptor [Hyphomonadaceae bacterium]|nr:TonB-dependent receptor [Hyphomonadaceae bacterium]
MSTKKKELFRNSLAKGVSLLAAAAGAAALTPNAMAQNADEDEAIVVTGTRIHRQDYVANSPIVTVDQDDFIIAGTATVDTLMNDLPQFTPGVNLTSNNPSNGGQANIQLRGLGSNRTLVLLNGRRLIPSNAGGQVDVNLIPSSLIGNVEIITGGASAAYGSDAIGGVANFITRRDVNGWELETQYGETAETDGQTQTIGITVGGPFADDRGRMALTMSYNNREPIQNSAREFSAISGASASSPLGSTIFDATNRPTNASVQTATGSALTVNSNTFGFNNNNSLFDYTGRRNFVSPGGIDYDGFAQPGPFFSPNFNYNTGALNYNVLPLTRYNVFGTVEYDLTDHITSFTEALFTQYSSANELAATPAAGSTTGFRVPYNNPFVPASLAAVLATRSNPTAPFRLDKRFSALGPRHAQEDYTVYQITQGFRGEIDDNWSFDIYGSYGRMDRTTTQTGNVSRGAVMNLLWAGINPATGATTGVIDGGASLCAGGFDWYGETALSAECQAYIGRTSKNLNTSEQRTIEATLEGALFSLPAGDVRVAVGTSYRDERFQLIPDASLSAAFPSTYINSFVGLGAGGDIAGFNSQQPLSGEVDVYEIFGEVLVPIIRGAPLVEEFNVSLAGRVSDYSTAGTVSSYKGDFDWTIVDGLRVRGGYQNAVRAPSISDLFSAVNLNFPAIGNPNTGTTSLLSGDPCDIRSAYRSTNGSGANLAASTNNDVRALCIAQGVAAGVVNSYTYTNGQVPGFTGGNPNLSEETATTWSTGVVFTPHIDNVLLRNFSMSVDYYNIEIEDVISTISASTMIFRCYNGDGVSNPTYSAANPYCNLFSRDPLSGNIINATSTNQNLAGLRTSGIDLQLDWRWDELAFVPGSLDLSYIVGWIEESSFQTSPGQPFNDSVGTIGTGLGSATPEWKWLLSTNYQIGGARIGARWRYVGEMTNASNPSEVLAATSYYDLLASYDFNDHVTLRAGVNNVSDQQPRTYSPSIQANTDPSTYDTLGRRAFVGVNVRF